MEEFQLGLAVDTNGHDSGTAKEVVDKERDQWKNYSLG
jgi:hypothetical protein